MPSVKQQLLALKIGSLDPSTFRVLEFKGTEQISGCFEFNIKANSEEKDLAYDDMIGQPAALTVAGDDFEVRHHGVISTVDQTPRGKGLHLYEFKIVPRIYMLERNQQNRIFQSMTVQEIVEEVLKQSGMEARDFKFEAKDKFPKREFTVQYNETDFHFITRLLEDEGIFYFFRHEDGLDVTVFANGPTSVEDLPNTPEVLFHPDTGMQREATDFIESMKKIQRMVTEKVTVKDYNYRTPQVNIMAQAGPENAGELYVYGAHVKTTDEAQRIAKIRAEGLAGQKVKFEGKGSCRSMRTGYRFKIDDPHETGFDGTYLITEVHHQGNQKEGFEGEDSEPQYQNTFTCIPADVPFRPDVITSKPKVEGLLTAVVDGQKGKYAYIDEEGRYRMKLHFDRGSESDGKASRAVRMAQPYSGKGYGMHFPLHTGTEIAVGFVNGDIDRPIIIGTIPNPDNSTPAKSGNNSQNVIRSHSGHQLCLEDKEGETGVNLNTSGGHSLSLDDTASKKGITVNTTDGHILGLDDKNQKIFVGTKDGHQLVMDDKGTKFTLETKDGHKVVLDDGGKSITVESKGGHSLKLDDSGKNVDLTSTGKHKTEAKDEITLTVGQSTLSMKKDGTIVLSGKKISLEAMTDIELSGMNIKLDAKQKVTVGGLQEISLAGAAASMAVKPTGVETSGPMVKISATGMLDLSGPMVKIN